MKQPEFRIMTNAERRRSHAKTPWESYEMEMTEQGVLVDIHAVTILGEWLEIKGKIFTFQELRAELDRRRLMTERVTVQQTVLYFLKQGVIYKHSGYGRGKQNFQYGFTKHLSIGVEPPTVAERRQNKKKFNPLRRKMTHAEGIDAIKEILRVVEATYATKK